MFQFSGGTRSRAARRWTALFKRRFRTIFQNAVRNSLKFVENQFRSSDQTTPFDMDPPKRFSKIKVFQTLGLLSRKFNPDTSEFESTLSLRLLFWISMISREYFAIKMWVSCFFPQTSSIQLYVVSSGSIDFNREIPWN